MLKDFKAHEKKCLERTVVCPIERCGAVVKDEESDEDDSYVSEDVLFMLKQKLKLLTIIIIYLTLKMYM